MSKLLAHDCKHSSSFSIKRSNFLPPKPNRDKFTIIQPSHFLCYLHAHVSLCSSHHLWPPQMKAYSRKELKTFYKVCRLSMLEQNDFLLNLQKKLLRQILKIKNMEDSYKKLESVPTFDDFTINSNDIPNIVVWDDFKLPDNSGEVPKTEWSGWQFNSWLWNLLSIWQTTSQVATLLLCS